MASIKPENPPRVKSTTNAQANVLPTGVEATGAVSQILVWGPIVPGQDPSWTGVTDTQDPTWSSVSDTQTPGWEEVA